MKTREITLKKKFAQIISSRAAVQNIFNFNNDSLEELNIDFSEINFISSSAAHQIVIETDALKKLEIEVKFTNIQEDVQRMINLARTDRKNIFTTHPVSVYNVSSKKDLETLFL